MAGSEIPKSFISRLTDDLAIAATLALLVRSIIRGFTK